VSCKSEHWFCDRFDSANAGAEIRMTNGWALMGKFGGEFGEGKAPRLTPAPSERDIFGNP